MNRRERERFIASLTGDELERLRDRLSGANGPDAPSDADRRFASSFFRGEPGDQADDDDRDGQFTDEQRAWVKALFAGDDEDAGVLAGLAGGRTVGRTSRPEPETEDRGRWFDPRPIVDD